MDCLEPLAIVGMAMRLPGGVRCEDDFWNLLVQKRSGLCDIPTNRFSTQGFQDAKGKVGTFKTPQGYYLSDVNIQDLDASAFSISQKELEKLDPQQRQLMEVAYECLESAGETRWANSRTACYVGAFSEDAQDLNAKETQHRGGYRVTSWADFVLANRISYEFNLTGPRRV